MTEINVKNWLQTTFGGLQTIQSGNQVISRLTDCYTGGSLTGSLAAFGADEEQSLKKVFELIMGLPSGCWIDDRRAHEKRKVDPATLTLVPYTS